MMNATESPLEALHPFFPLGVVLSDYVANTINGPLLVGYFAAGSAAILTTAYAIVSHVNPNLSGKNIWTALWFTLCGCIHFFFEGKSSMPLSHSHSGALAS